KHLDFPGEEQVDFDLSAAGDGLNQLDTLHAVDGFFDGPGDGDEHLVYGGDAVIDADDDAGEIGGWEDGDGNGAGEIDADADQSDDDEDHRFGVGSRPVPGFVQGCSFAEDSMRMRAPSSRPSPPAVTTCSPDFRPLRT